MQSEKYFLISFLSSSSLEMNEIENKKTNLTAQIYAVTGAIQQCDLFLQQLNGGNDKDVTSSIPSEPKKKGSNDVASAVMS